MANIRCKYRCESVTRSVNWRNDPEKPFLYAAKFHAVHDDSPENKSFFESTPGGSLEICTYKDDVFTPGKQYFIDLTLAE